MTASRTRRNKKVRVKYKPILINSLPINHTCYKKDCQYCRIFSDIENGELLQVIKPIVPYMPELT